MKTNITPAHINVNALQFFITGILELQTINPIV